MHTIDHVYMIIAAHGSGGIRQHDLLLKCKGLKVTKLGNMVNKLERQGLVLVKLEPAPRGGNYQKRLTDAQAHSFPGWGWGGKPNVD